MLTKAQIEEFFTCMHIYVKQAEILFDYVDFYEDKADVLKSIKLVLIDSFLDLNKTELQELNELLELFNSKDYNKVRFNFMRSIPVLQVLDDAYYTKEFFDCLVFIANKTADKSHVSIEDDAATLKSEKTNFDEVLEEFNLEEIN